ncbi:MAG: hypothetical protein U5P41_15085 [Gammaproteobacteria bacterium]|nr:hypothetical protein [Gammaproteobacteria bacterium]
MTSFNDLLRASGEDLVRTFYAFHASGGRRQKTPAAIARELKLTSGQLMCGVGFNPHARESTEIVSLLGFKRFADIEERRNEYFAKDIYRRLSLDNILAIYDIVKDDSEALHSMQYLLKRRLQAIEENIESTVNSLTIEKYKAEIRAIYSDGIATIDFAKERLTQMDNGFRALVNEVSMITEYKLIPVGEVFFMDTILPQEKRRLLERGLIPSDLVETRLQDSSISSQETRVLREFLRQQKNRETRE